MGVSARNVLAGKITGLIEDAVNAEVEVTLAGGVTIVAIVTQESVRRLALGSGREVEVHIKAPWVMLLAGGATGGFSARNQFVGRVCLLQRGAVNTEVGLELPGGTVLHALTTNEAVLELGLCLGEAATALIKASDVILAVRE